MDELADGSGMAKLTWISKELLKTPCKFNSLSTQKDDTNDNLYKNGTGVIGGWSYSTLRLYMNANSIYPIIPKNVKQNIVSVKKTHSSMDEGRTIINQTTYDKLWVPSKNEIENKYKIIFSSKTKYIVNTSSESYWWLRDIDDGYNGSVLIVTTAGSISYQAPTLNVARVALGFCF